MPRNKEGYIEKKERIERNEEGKEGRSKKKRQKKMLNIGFKKRMG